MRTRATPTGRLVLRGHEEHFFKKPSPQHDEASVLVHADYSGLEYRVLAWAKTVESRVEESRVQEDDRYGD